MSNHRPPTLGEFGAHEAKRAIHDIREKLFNEAWSGRPAAPEPAMEIAKERDVDKSRGPTFDELWGRSAAGKEQPELGPELGKDKDEPEIER